MNVPGDILIIQLQVFRWNNDLSPYKYIPEIALNEELICSDKFELTGIVWHSGDSTNSGHYTCNVRINNTWFYTDDINVTEGLKEYLPMNITSNQDEMVPYLLVYKKTNRISEPLDSSLACILPNSEVNPESTNKESFFEEVCINDNRDDHFDQDDCVSTKKMRLESTVNTNESIQTMKRIENLDSLLEVDEESNNYDRNEYGSDVSARKYNFTKRKCRYSNKHNEAERQRKANVRSNLEARNAYNEDQKQRMRNVRSTTEGRNDYNEDQRQRMEELREKRKLSC